MFYAGAADIELYRTETTYYRDNLGNRRAVALGRDGAGRRRSALSAGHRDGRSGRGRGVHRERRQSGRAVPMPANRSRRSLRRSSPSTMSSGSSSSASATARTPSRSRAAAMEITTNERAREAGFPCKRWSRRKREVADERRELPRATTISALVAAKQEARKPAAQPSQAAQAAKAEPEFDIATLPPIEFDQRAVRHHGVPARGRSGRTRPVRRFDAYGPPIRRSAISSASPRTPGTSPTLTRCRASVRSKRPTRSGR